MTSTTCALAITEIVDLLESGSEPFPILFVNQGCGGLKWPKPGDESKYNWNSMSLPASIFWTGTNAFTSYPGFESAIVPNNLRVSFFAKTGASRVFEYGQYDLQASPNLQGTVSQSTNIWKVGNPNMMDSSCGSSSRWHKSDGAGEPTKCSVGSEGFPNCPGFYYAGGPSNQGTLVKTIVSCGAPFWPSFAGVKVDGGSHEFVQSNNTWIAEKNTCYDWGGEGQVAFTSHDFHDRGQCRGTGWPNCATQNLAFHTVGCMTFMQETNFHGGTDFSGSGGGCGADVDIESDGSPPSQNWECGFDQGCGSANFWEASVETVSVRRLIPWREEQLQACVGKTLTIGGIRVDRYGNGEPACDTIVEELCQNTAEIANNPSYLKLCACVLEKKRIDAQFAGLDLPVQCFSDICSDSDPAVYKTTQQSKGCSARLCLQVLDINGSAIAAEGHQTILCNGETYTVSETNTSVTPVPVVSPDLSSGVIKLGPTFFIALGLLVIMILLLVTWGVRKLVVQRRRHRKESEKITQELESALGRN